VCESHETLDGAEAERVERWLEALATRRRRDANARALADTGEDAAESPGVPRSYNDAAAPEQAASE
jgi:hypothetical protein